MAEYKKVCESCNRPYAAGRRNAKRCAICRLSRDVEFMNDRLHDCWICDAKFAPLEQRDKTCGACQYEPKRWGIAECVQCGEERPRVTEDVNLCMPCAKVFENRPWLILQLRKKIRYRRTHPVEPEVLAQYLEPEVAHAQI